jgi:uncharacterized membrane protein
MSKKLFNNIFSYIDIVLVLCVLLIVLSASNKSFISIIGTAILIFFIPGYLFCSALLSNSTSISFPFLLILSVGISVVISGLFFLLVGLTIGLNSYSTKSGLTLLIILLSLINIRKRSKENRELLEQPTFRIKERMPNSLSGWAKYIALIILIIVFANYLRLTEVKNAQYSEFFILGKDGAFDNYPSDVLINDKLPITTTIVNHEGRDILYSLEAKVNDNLVGSIEPFIIKSGESWTGDLVIDISLTEKDQPINLLLYKNGNAESYRSLHLWINRVK